MWRKYFGPLATIVGIDHMPRCKKLESEGTFVRIGSQEDQAFLQNVIDEFGVPDVVLDDGSHQPGPTNAAFEFLYPLMRSRSIYIVEDLHTAYMPEFGGSLENQSTFINRTKALIDKMHESHTNGAISGDKISSQTLSIHVYDSIIALHKGSIKNKKTSERGEFLSDF